MKKKLAEDGVTLVDDPDQQGEVDEQDESQVRQEDKTTVDEDDVARDADGNVIDPSGEDDSVVVLIGEESPSSEEEDTAAPKWVKDLRREHRETVRRNRELEEKLAAVSGAVQKPVELGKKPTLEDFDYDTDKYEGALDAWHLRKREADAEAATRAAAEKAQRDAWQAKLDNHNKLKTDLKVKDYDDAEEIVRDNFSVTQQGIILQGSENSAVLMYALGKNPKRAKELAAIKDPILFTFAIAKLETQLKIQPKKSAPAPESVVRGNTGRVKQGNGDQNLERLRAEAERTGDYTEVNAYKQRLKQKTKKA